MLTKSSSLELERRPASRASMKVTYFQRHRYADAFSVEQVFSSIRESLPENIEWQVVESKYTSRGFLRRLYNAIEAALKQGEINHITGDVHFLACTLAGNRTILTVHDCRGIDRLTGFRRELLRLFWFTIPCLRSEFVTTISEFTKTELMRYSGCPPEKVRIIPDPIGPGFVPYPREFDEECPVILQVGVASHKNLERVAEALRGIRCRMQIVGNISKSQKSALERNGVNYSYKGRLSNDEIIASYRSCDLLLFASTYEGFGLPIIEAQATGRPVITSNVCSMPEVAGDGACLVNPFDVQSIRDGVLRVIEDRQYRTSLVERGFCNVQRFSGEKVAEQYLELYEEILRRQSRAS